MISLDNLTVSYGGWTLFDNISLLINPKDRIGLVLSLIHISEPTRH